MLFSMMYVFGGGVDPSAYELDAQRVLSLNQRDFLQGRSNLCYALAKLNHYGETQDLRVRGKGYIKKDIDPLQAAYWYIEAAKTSNEDAPEIIEFLLGTKEFNVFDQTILEELATKIKADMGLSYDTESSTESSRSSETGPSVGYSPTPPSGEENIGHPDTKRSYKSRPQVSSNVVRLVEPVVKVSRRLS